MRKFLEQALAQVGAAHEAKWIEEFVDSKNLKNPAEVKNFIELIIQRRLSGEPLAYIVGEWAFRDLEFKCGPGVLIPRPETEELVELVLEWVKKNPKLKWFVADFGAGTGCIGISVALGIKKLYPTSPVNLTFLESSASAALYLKENCRTHLDGQYGIQYEIVEKSWNEWTAKSLHLFLSNPPYLSEVEFQQIDSGVSAFEPKSALVPVDDQEGFESYRQLLKLASETLIQSEASFLIFELGTFQADWILNEAAKHLPSFKSRIEKDMANKERFLVTQNLAI